MAITAAGVGSGLDIETIITQLMTLERQPLNELQSQESATNADLSAYGQIKSAIENFKDTMSNLGSLDRFKIFTANSSDSDVFTAEADSDAAAGIYNLNVERLAQNHKLGSDEFLNTDTFGGTAGDALTVTVGSESLSVDLSTAKTLAEIRDAINSDESNPGVTATILNTGESTQRLILTADESGYDSRLQLSFGGSLNATTFNFSTTNQDAVGDPLIDLTQLDAAYTLDGFALTSASNSVSGVMDGLTLNLQQTGSATLSVARDTSSIEKSAKAFVSAYNTVITGLDKLRQGQLSGDSTIRGIQTQMRNVLNSPPSGLSGAFSALSEVGITTNAKTGELEFSSSDFSKALDTDFEGVAQLFANDDQGYAYRFQALADTLVDSEGVIATRQDSLNDRISQLQDSQSDWERRLDIKEQSLRSQYAALDALLGSLQSTSNYLLQNLSSSN